MKMIVLLALLLSTSIVTSMEYAHTIYIDPSSGKDGSDCLAANNPLSTPCCNLTWVFQQSHHSSTQYVLSEGTHFLTELTPPFQDLTSLAFTGNTSVINCTDTNTGLTFLNVVNVSFYDISFYNCSVTQNSTSKNFIDNTISQFKVALYFSLCESISMTHVSVSHSPNATGVVVYDTNGTNVISQSNFSHNSVSGDYQGGGGFYVEFTYCEPAGTPPPNSERNKGAYYAFTSCEFKHNRADNFDNNDQFTYIFPRGVDHQAFGHGGGLSYFIRGNTSDTSFVIEDSLFYDNTAVWGGGLFIEFHDNTHGNNVTVRNTNFSNNTCQFTASGGTAGGGIRLGYFVYGPLPATATRNSIVIDNCTFVKNLALYGAGVSIKWALQLSQSAIDQAALIHILNTFFQANNAKLGVALHVDQFKSFSRGHKPSVWIENSTFDANTDLYFIGFDDSEDTPLPLGLGVVCVFSSDVWFRNGVNFTNSIGSALAVAGGTVSFDGHALFANNSANRGAGIILLGSSTIELGHNTKLVFRNNSAGTFGGAVHAVHISRENLRTDLNCFFRYVDPTIAPDDWNVTVEFVDNWDQKRSSRNSIFATSTLPCSIVGGSGVFNSNSTNRVFCWKGWSYYNSSTEEDPVECGSQISSDIGRLQYTSTDSAGRNYAKAFPGWDFILPITALDDLDRDISSRTIFNSAVNSSYYNASYIYGEKTAVLGLERSSYFISLDSVGERRWYADVVIDLLPCPPGFKAAEDGVCICSNTYAGSLSCNFKAKEAHLSINAWMGLHNDSYYTAPCPPKYCKTYTSSERFVRLPNSSEALSERLCAPHRTGVMCGECTKNYGPAINLETFECVNCTDINLAANIAKYVASSYIPLVTLFMILILFDLRLTTGPANAFILYCQVASSTFIPNSIQSCYDAIYQAPYGIFNLNFVENYIPPICFSAKFNTLTILLLDYLVALSPLMLILLVLLLLKVQERTCCNVRKISYGYSKLLRNKGRSIGEALLPAFASFLLLSYTKFSTISAYIMATRFLTDEDGNRLDQPQLVYLAGQFTSNDGDYYPYFVTALFVFCTFVAIPPLLLLDFPLRALEWLVSKSRHFERIYPSIRIHILLETFQGCYRKNMRFFAGLYFIFRLFINVSYVFCDTWLKQFAVQQVACSLMVMLVALFQPYRRKLLNRVDVLVFTNLSILNCLSHYLYAGNMQYNRPIVEFTVFYILIFLPLACMAAYILWFKTKHYHSWIVQAVCRCCRSSRKETQLNTVIKDDSTPVPHSFTPRLPTEPKDADEAFFARAEERNKYQRLTVTVVGINGCKGEDTVHQTATRSPVNSSGLGTCGSGTSCTYGSTGTSSSSASGRSDS